MKFGNIFSYQPPGESHKEVMDRFVRLGVASEELNFDTYWLEHHFTEFGLTGNLFVACANLLGRTTKLNVGTMIVLPTAHPARQMEDLLLLDQMSKGRFNFGVVRGYHKDFRVFGVTMEDSRAITEDFHTMIMDGTKTGLHTDGKNIEFPDVNVYPEAYLEKIPTCMTAESATTTWLAERGLPMVLSWIITTSEKKAQMELYNAVRDSGYSEEYIKNVDHSMTLICSVDEDGKKAEDVREFLGNWYDSYVNATNIFSESNQTRGYDYHKGQKDFVLQGHTNTKRRVDYSNDLNPVGTPEKCIEIQRDIDATGITNITLGFEANGSEEEIIASMKRFMQVAPFLKDPK
uniref:Alkanal monooxygenase alpha chain n=1 Tax=Photobacterium phosphoreum TaxID=659 RepID=LUXA_PHOPO|nr:RecName: Full=Alkanal monooxygenase alpha chain; AltName: Full=Bacterial luciferase alpha chain [Photobacterium phosphoreum]AAA70297.1 luciferase alpha subunit [Photobacterium phosphoreum]